MKMNNNLTQEEKLWFEELKKDIPIDLLSKEDFETLKNIKFIPQAIKFVHSKTDLGLKLSKVYVDLYIKENYE